MRALILLESLIVIGLAAGILLGSHPGAAAPEGDIFPAQRFLLDADPGETVRYRIDQGRSILQFTVGPVSRGGADGPPRLQIHRAMFDGQGQPLNDEAPEYVHLPHRHGLFPFLAADAPGALDRVWIVKRIRREERLPWQGKELRCWHVECIDPALPKDRDAVDVWMHEDVPVFGILRYQRDGHVYEADWKPRP